MAILDENDSLISSLGGSKEGGNATVYLEETGNGKQAIENENDKYSFLASHVRSLFNKSKDKRLTEERRWLEAHRNYRGIYGPETQFRDNEKSKAFIKITKTKVHAAFAQTTDIIFSGNKFPIEVRPSPVTTSDQEDSVYIDPEEDKIEEQTGYKSKSATIARQDIFNKVGPYKGVLERVKDKLRLGTGKTPTAQTWEPNVLAARNMDKKIQDQLEENDASKSLRSTLFEMCLFGTGIYKGPSLKNKEYPKWTKDGKYEPVFMAQPDLRSVSIWDSYPDPDATSASDMEFFIERHRLSKTELRNLKKRPFFREESIEIAIETGNNYTPEYWETSLEAQDGDYLNPDIQRWEVLEFWGYVDKDLVEGTEIQIPKEYKDKDQIQVNIWICHNQIIRLVYNPFTPERIPYYIIPYEINPYSVWGIGVADNMADTQQLMNGFLRLAVDNAVLSSNVMLEIDEDMLVPGQEMKFHPGKIFRRQGGQPGQSIHTIKVENQSQESIQLFDKARQLADEATGMPSYSHGISGVMGVGRTAAGMQMLMGAAAQNIKSVVRNLDDYLFAPLGRNMFAFNMQFSFDEKYVGDLEVVAKGTESLVKTEIRTQKLLQFLQLSSNPMDAPFIKRDYLLREIALGLDIDPEKAINDPREAAIQATMLAEFMKKMGIDPNNQKQSNSNVQAPTGAEGGPVAEPSSEGFSGEGGGSNIGQPPQGGQVGGGQNSQ